MSANCGPLNPLQKFTNHSQIDRSLHQDHQQLQRNQQSNSFRQQNLNPQLEREFQQQFNPALQNAFQGAQFNNHNPQIQKLPNQPQFVKSGGWANDFSNLSLNASNQQHFGPQQRSSDWSSQFVTQTPIQNVGSSSMHQQPQSMYHQNHMIRPIPQLTQNFARQQLIPQAQNRTEHQELHHQQQFHKDLESEFSRLEEQFEQQTLNQHELKDELETPKNRVNEEFQKAATSISAAMSQTSDATAGKFASSNFLKLMQQVSNGQVTLNDEATKLVDEQGNDIHQDKLESRLPDPLEGLSMSDLTDPFETAQKVGNLHNESYNWDDAHADPISDTPSFQGNRLPDPLAGLNAADLTSPFEAAKRVAALHHEEYTWDDVIADYRQDDDSF